MMTQQELKAQLDGNAEIRKHLFEKGFMITDAEIPDMSAYPFYGNWSAVKIMNYHFLTYRQVPLYTVADKDKVHFLIGHAYNPYDLETDENKILRDPSQDKIDELTGVFLLGCIENDGKIRVQPDASGMQYACYGRINGKCYISSHMRLPADICGLAEDPYVEELVAYRWYKYMLGNYLPGDLTCCKELKRIIPNTSIQYDGHSFSIKRFYPAHEIKMCSNPREYDSVIAEGARVLKNTMDLIARKWSRPAISLTGGIDSNTTFAAANGNYEKFRAFSYISMYREQVDAEAASRIAKEFNVPHVRFEIPDKNGDCEGFDLYKAVFEHNDGDIGTIKDNDIRKKIHLLKQDFCDVEVKSWISETIRGYAYKYFGRSEFPESLTPRDYTSLYKIFIGNRKLCRRTDRFFERYLTDTDLKNHLFNYDETDFFIWEMEHGGKCGLDIGVMKSDFDITIPYNNRKFLDTMLRIPLAQRIRDDHHLAMKKLLDPRLYDMNIRIVNLNETQKRKKLINLYYIINSHLPF